MDDVSARTGPLRKLALICSSDLLLPVILSDYLSLGHAEQHLITIAQVCSYAYAYVHSTYRYVG